MNVNQLAKIVSRDTGQSIREAEDSVWAVFDAIARSLASGDTVTITNFGTFAARERAATTGRDINTGNTIKVPAQYVARFTPTGRLKTMVRDHKTKDTIRKPIRGANATTKAS